MLVSNHSHLYAFNQPRGSNLCQNMSPDAERLSPPSSPLFSLQTPSRNHISFCSSDEAGSQPALSGEEPSFALNKRPYPYATSRTHCSPTQALTRGAAQGGRVLLSLERRRGRGRGIREERINRGREEEGGRSGKRELREGEG